ncbi:MAG TPA: DNA/RNA non-specific endonuclease [Candidatus Limosilactobacillus excrementigallinarum]|nr:DNA/RNA non-specific endonuclease [Candidatus Limosilactobacillus excrementigallinarum]
MNYRQWLTKISVGILAFGIGIQAPVATQLGPSSQVTAFAAKKHHLTVDEKQLANLDYQGQQIIMVNNNQPTFTSDDLDTSKGSWQKYASLDRNNRATGADALLNKSMMPTTKREPLHVNPSGWHNKKVNGKYLYNRSHLIGYQLSGQNNNWKNLITGTRSLNDPAMLKYEDQVASFLKRYPNQYVRYQVTPIYRGSEKVARGVHMQGQSVGSDAVKFNVYLFNVQDGVNINYDDGTSQVTSAQPKSTTTPSSSSATPENSGADDNQNQTVYVTPSGHKYHYDPNCRALRRSHTVSQMTVSQARNAGYTPCGLE